ncbi:hypothetical protein [Microbacterium sp. NPDC056736]|uniref:hypothetical protein n=1 Tax=Microbacterium sp. NPDC056736 TaxID=3345932 RepID=UPI00366C13C4
MEVVRARVDGQMFILDPEQDVAELQRLIIEAVQQGAGFVDFQTVGRSGISVMITPYIGVRFETIERTPEQVEEWEFHPPSIEPGDGVYDDMIY